jgi:hypothetical protein
MVDLSNALDASSFAAASGGRLMPRQMSYAAAAKQQRVHDELRKQRKESAMKRHKPSEHDGEFIRGYSEWQLDVQLSALENARPERLTIARLEEARARLDVLIERASAAQRQPERVAA